MERAEREKAKKKKRTIFIFIVVLLILGFGAFVFFLYYTAKKTVDEQMHDPVESIDIDLTKKKVKATEPLTVLLLGIDATEHQQGRSDAIMVMRLIPKHNSLTIVSIPRDTRVHLVGRDTEDKINHAYAFGGASMAVATIEEFLDIDIDYYMTINMDGLVELVDEVGTITVNNEVAWSDGKYNFPKGKVEMDGEKTIAYVRMRKEDPMGDFGRTYRQRKVVEGILNEGATVGSLPKLYGLLDILGSNMTTNMDFTDMKKLFTGYTGTRNNIKEYMIEGAGQTIDGTYYLVVPDEEVEKVHNLLAN